MRLVDILNRLSIDTYKVGLDNSYHLLEVEGY